MQRQVLDDNKLIEFYKATELLLHCLQALVQASFALPQALAAALVSCSVQLPRPLTHLAAIFDQHGLYLADILPHRPWVKQVAHRDGMRMYLENACQGLELQHVLQLFAETVRRYSMYTHSILTYTHTACKDFWYSPNAFSLCPWYISQQCKHLCCHYVWLCQLI